MFSPCPPDTGRVAPCATFLDPLQEQLHDRLSILLHRAERFRKARMKVTRQSLESPGWEA